MSKILQLIQQDNISFKVQVSIVVCTGIPKTGKTSFSYLLMKNQPKDTTDYNRDHHTIYIKRKNKNVREDVKWEKIELNKLIDQLKNYIEGKNEYSLKMTKTSDIQMQHLQDEIVKIKDEEIWSILIILDVSVPTLAIDLLPPSIVTFVTCRICDQAEELSIEELESSLFINALMSCNSFKTNPKENSAFDELIEKKYKGKKRYYTAFVGVYKKHISKSSEASINTQLKNLHDKLDHLQCSKLQEISYPYWFSKDGILNSVDIDNTNDGIAECLCDQMEKQLFRSTIYNVPITWLLLYFEILKRCEGNKFVHYKTILDSVWKNMCNNKNEDELKIALSFFHYQEALLYYKDIDGICNYIFKDTRWLFE